MFGISLRTRQNGTSSPRSSTGSPSSVGSPRPAGTPGSMASPKAEVGEIDTRAPFRSVRAAVSLFGESVVSPRTPVHKRSKSIEERVLEKETQHQMTLRQLENLKDDLRSIQATKHEAVREMDKANRTLEKLTSKLEMVSESKQAAILETEASKKKVTELEERKSSKAQIGAEARNLDVVSVRDQYKASAAELSSAKQELTNLRQDFDAALEAKLAGFQAAADVQHSTQVNQERVRKLSRDISNVRGKLSQVKLASQQAQEEHVKLIAEKEARIQSHKIAKEEIDEKIRCLKEEFESGLNEDFEGKIEETNETITVLEEQLNNVRASTLKSLKTVNSELESSRKKLQEIVSEENSLRSLVDRLKLELENAKREHSELEKATTEAESAELKAINAGEIKSADTHLTTQQLSSVAEAARKEAEELRKNAELLNQEAETARLAAKKIEERLQIASKEAEEAKAAEKLADDQVHNSSKTDAAHPTNSKSSGKIKLSAEDFEALRKKVEQSKADADVKVATAMAQVETIRASEKEVLKKLEASQKENQDLKATIADVLKQTEMAEAAKQVVEVELRRRREKEQKEAGL